VKRDAASHAADEAWIFVIVHEDEPAGAAGTVSVWTHETQNGVFDEIGWMVLPPYQGKGLGKSAVREVLDRARASGRWKELHAFPAVGNAASNAMCRSLGFTLVEELDFEFRDRKMRGNHWRIDLTE
jgi:RimJ/RimL family protein N-acetyltransferase